jgi:phenylalanyl-tRNA synthetase beta subunit
MKIPYSHLIDNIKEKPSIEKLSDNLFQLGHEHDIVDNIFDMEFTPNRGDCLSLNGILRDLGCFYNIDYKKKIYTKEIDSLSMEFENLSEKICPQISFLKIEIDNIPKNYKGDLNKYFEDLNLNKNNFYTDVSNYLSYETGQPTHCYDADKINDKLVFHEINKELEFETLLNKKITLSGKNAVFSLKGDVINLAGVVGGKSTSCSTNTKTVIIECAYFQPEAILGKSVKYDIQSEASHKFERGVDPMCQEKVLRRFANIVSEHANIQDISIITHKYNDNPIYKIPIDVDKINEIIGINLSDGDYLTHLKKLGFEIKKDFIQVPSFRSDVKTQNDLAEEVARVIGYDNIKILDINIPKDKKIIHKNVESKLRHFLLDNGFYEVINSPFVRYNSNNSIKVDNPLDSNRKFLRTNITNSLVDNLLYNEKRQKDSVKLFEISDIYMSDKGIKRVRRFSIIASGRVGHNYEDFSRKINKKYLVKIFQEFLPKQTFDFNIIPRSSLNTKIKNEIYSLEVDIDMLSDDALNYKAISSPPKSFIQYEQISEKPSSFKDISYSIKDFNKTEELQALLLSYKSTIIKHIYIFDYFKNEKKEEIKIGFRFVFQASNRTLTDTEITNVLNDIITKTTKIEGVKIPGLNL